jgi:hypothetical protein
MYTKLFEPVISRVYPCTTEEVKHSTQKEKRIIDTIEPLLNRHRLIIDRKVIEDDHRTVMSYDGENKFMKALIYQMTRITYDRGALRHDDRLDALAIALGYWVEQVNQDEKRGIANMKNRAMEDELRKYMQNAVDPMGRRVKPRSSAGLAGVGMGKTMSKSVRAGVRL